MSVVIETTQGDITVDLYLEQRPVTCLNFLKLCKMKYYNYNLFHSIRSGFIAQTGDPTGEGSGGQSIFGILEGPQRRFFSGEKMPKIRHTDTGLLSMVCTGDMMVGSQFFFTLAPDLDSLDGVHCVIGEVTEGHDVLRKLNDVICDETHRPYRDVRITHTVILEDPFNDPAGFRAPSRSPSPSAERLVGGRIAPDEDIDETEGKSVAEVHEMIEEKEAKARATILEIIGDLPDADIAPPENVLFICKLNPVTTDEDLEIIFSRFGKIVSCEVIRDKKTGDSLQYAFIEFSDKKSCEDAYFKMDNVLIDDRRIHVDFSQSVSKVKWLGKGRGVKHFSDDDIKFSNYNRNEHSNEKHFKHKEYENGKEFDLAKDNNNDKKRYDNKKYVDRERHQDRHRRNEKYSGDRERSRSRSKKDNQKTRDDKFNTHKNSKESNRANSGDIYRSQKEYKKTKTEDSRHVKHTLETDNNEELKYYRNKHISADSSYKNKKKKIEKSEKNSDRKRHKSFSNIENNRGKRVYKESEYKKSNHSITEPRTPSPIPRMKEKKIKNNVVNKLRNKRKKHKHSTSDSDSSETSSSSSTSTSSSERDKKKNVLRRKKRRYSSSSSSSSSSSDSTSSSSSSSSSTSSSTSSDSDTDKAKRCKKTATKKEVQRLKKKLYN